MSSLQGQMLQEKDRSGNKYKFRRMLSKSSLLYTTCLLLEDVQENLRPKVLLSPCALIGLGDAVLILEQLSLFVSATEYDLSPPASVPGLSHKLRSFVAVTCDIIMKFLFISQKTLHAIFLHRSMKKSNFSYKFCKNYRNSCPLIVLKSYITTKN